MSESEVSSDPPPYFWAENVDEIRRAFIIDVMASADIDGSIMVDNMDKIFDWLKSGKVTRKK